MTELEFTKGPDNRWRMAAGVEHGRPFYVWKPHGSPRQGQPVWTGFDYASGPDRTVYTFFTTSGA